MKLTVYSHCTIDTLVVNDSSYEQLGGPGCYCCLTIKRLKSDVILNTKFGVDFNGVDYLKEKGINIKNGTSQKPTTRFTIYLEGSNRTLFVTNTCEPIDHIQENTDGIIISPVFNEISQEVYEKIKKDSNFIMVDPQGFLRRKDSKNKIYLERTDIDFSHISTIKTNPDELYCLTGVSGIDAMKSLQKQGIENVIVPDKREISMLVKDRLYTIILPNLEIYDTTGIGDIFCATFSNTFLKEKDFFWALCFGAGAAQAAFETKRIGLEKIPEKGAVETNASYLYNEVKFKHV